MNEFIGPFRLLREIGRGHNAIVYEAHDTRRDEPVALKVLYTDEVEPEDGKLSLRGEATILRFVREADAIRRLQHPNIVRIRDAGADGVRLYIAMERLRGETLRARLLRGPLPLNEAVNVALQMTAALTLAHGQGIVHRDIKPDNIFLLADGTAKLMDFGAARVTGEQSLTQTGNIIGSPAYMSPEQVNGGDADGRTDIWGLAATLFEAVTGHKPFTGDSVTSVMYAILHKRPDFSLVPSPPLARVLERALSKKAATRYPDMAAFAECLRNPPQRDDSDRCGTPLSLPLPLSRRSVVGIGVAAALGAVLLASFLAANRQQHAQQQPQQRRTVTTATPTPAAPEPVPSKTAAGKSAPTPPPKARRPAATAVVVAAAPPRPLAVEEPQVSIREKKRPPQRQQQPRTSFDRPLVTDATPDPFARQQQSSPPPSVRRRPPVQVASAQETPVGAAASAPRPQVQAADRTRPARMPVEPKPIRKSRPRDRDPEANHRVEPQILPELEGFQGTVRLRVYIDADGVVKRSEFKQRSGNELADEVAREAVSQWEYVPAVRGGRNVEAVIEEVIIFN